MLLLPSSITGRTSVQTSAFIHAPTTVPIILPSGVPSIILFSLIGNEPLDEIIVDSAAFSCLSRRSMATLKTSSITTMPSFAKPDQPVRTYYRSFTDQCKYAQDTAKTGK